MNYLSKLPLLFLLLFVACTSNKPVAIHYNAFSHNDYHRESPLFDALSMGFNCVEADIYLVDGQLYVTHDLPDDISGLKTLDEMYFTPLFERIKSNQGRVYPHATQPFSLMVDIKQNGDAVYKVLQPFLEANKEMFCSYQNGEYVEGPILLFFSGSRPMKELPTQLTRYAFLDGTFADLEKNIPNTLIPVVSDNYKNFFTWKGEGAMPADELSLLRTLISKSHAEKKRIRFWGAPDSEAWAEIQISEGVDLIGTDNLKALTNLLNSK